MWDRTGKVANSLDDFPYNCLRSIARTGADRLHHPLEAELISLSIKRFGHAVCVEDEAITALEGNGAAPAAIRVRVNNNGTTDSMAFYDAANTTPLGLLAAGSVLSIYLDFVTGPTVFNATIARSGSTFTVTIGSLVSGAVTSNAKGKNTMTWQPSSQATSQATGIAVWPAAVTESGGSDNDF